MLWQPAAHILCSVHWLSGAHGVAPQQGAGWAASAPVGFSSSSLAKRSAPLLHSCHPGDKWGARFCERNPSRAWLEFCEAVIKSAIELQVVPDDDPDKDPAKHLRPDSKEPDARLSSAKSEELVKGIAADIGFRWRSPELPQEIRDLIADYGGTGAPFELEYAHRYHCPLTTTCVQLRDLQGDFHIACAPEDLDPPFDDKTDPHAAAVKPYLPYVDKLQPGEILKIAVIDPAAVKQLSSGAFRATVDVKPLRAAVLAANADMALSALFLQSHEHSNAAAKPLPDRSNDNALPVSVSARFCDAGVEDVSSLLCKPEAPPIDADRAVAGGAAVLGVCRAASTWHIDQASSVGGSSGGSSGGGKDVCFDIFATSLEWLLGGILLFAVAAVSQTGRGTVP